MRGDMGNELLSVLNTVMAAAAAALNLWGALRTSVLLRRTVRVVVFLVGLYIGAIYTAYLLDLLTVDVLGAVYLRPALLIILVVLAALPVVDLLDPVERLRMETDRIIEDLTAKYDLLQQQITLVLDRLAEAQTEIRRLKQVAARGDGWGLLVVVGDSAFDVDLSVLRKVQRVTGLPFVRISSATKGQFERKLERDRVMGRPVQWLHLSVHAGPDGAQFADGLASWTWLSEILDGVQVLVVAGCVSDRAVDVLGVVPHVIGFGADIENRDAMLFAEVFWMQMAEHGDVDHAVNFALDRCPPVLREIIERSW